jgi:hypothetical protein
MAIPLDNTEAGCCVDRALLQFIIKRKFVKLTLRWVKGRSTCVGINIADRTAENTCNALKTGMCNLIVINKSIKQMIDIKPL